ncbi:hypothetical protein [Chroococcidiopsis sp.]|uniref:hypothetical protein n=1 Tax=Chroococcidiopsis sp. TaxID=3088168 RepID=UPI003F31A2DE
MVYASFFFALTAKVRYFAPRVAGFWLWFVVVFGLVAIGLGLRAFESGKVFRDQFESGYNSLNGEFCPLTCGIACEIECVSIPEQTHELETNEEIYGEQTNFEPIEGDLYLVEFCDLGEWWIGSNKRPYKSLRHLKAAYANATKMHRQELAVV